MAFSSAEQFSMECGITGRLVLDVSLAGNPARLSSHAPPFVVLGRGQGVSLQLVDPSLSKRHAYIQVIQGQPYVVDLDSRTGVTLAGRKVISGWMPPGSPLGIGPFLVTPEYRSVPTQSAPNGDPLEQRLAGLGFPRAAFTVHQVDREPVRWRINRRLVLVGNSARCQVRLKGTNISRFHCALVTTEKGVWVVDLKSAAGTVLDGQPISFAFLEEGDVVELGDYRLVLSDIVLDRVTPEDRPSSADLPIPEILQDFQDESRTEADLQDSAFEQWAVPISVPTQTSTLAERTVPAVWQHTNGMESSSPATALVSLVQQMSLMQQQMFDQFQQTMMMMAQMMSSMHQENAQLLREELQALGKITEELQALRQEAKTRGGTEPAGPPDRHPNSRWQKGAWPGTTPAPTDPLLSGPAPAEETVKDEIHDVLNERIASLQSEQQTRWEKILRFLRGGA